MKKQAYTLIAMVILVGSMAAVARAQASAKLIANIPFEFNVGNKTLPAGEYTVRQVNPASDHAVLQLKSKDGRAGTLVQMGSVIGKAQASATLIFNRYGNHYFFAQAWLDGDKTGWRASKSQAERTAESELAGIKVKTETIALRNQ